MTTYKPGDPDPTPAEDSGVLCDCAATQGLFVCTWPAGHDGPHVAGTGTEIGAVWNTGDQIDDPDQALRLHLATCKGCTFCEATRELFRRVDQDVNGDLANWKPTGFLNRPADGPQWSTSAPPSEPVLKVAPESLALVREISNWEPGEPPDGATDCRTGTIGYCNMRQGHIGPHGEGPDITDASRMCGRQYHLTGPLAGTPITATPIWERAPHWADNLGICTKEIGHPDLHGNGPETTERHRCDAIYHLDGPLAGIPATKAAMAANIRSAITAEDTLEDGYNSLATALAAKQEFQRILIDGVGTLPGEHLDDFARRIVRFVQRHCPCTPDAPKHAHGVGGYATTPDWERADAPPEQEGKP